MKHHFTLDAPAIDFSDVAFLSFLSAMPDYVLADDLNHLYDLDLYRTDDADLGDISLPIYVYRDMLRHLDYFLVALSPAAEGFLLLLCGSSCHEVAADIEREFSTTADMPHTADMHAMRRYNIFQRYQSAFTPVSIVSFSDSELDEASAAGHRTLKGRAALADLFARILDVIDIRRLN